MSDDHRRLVNALATIAIAIQNTVHVILLLMVLLIVPAADHTLHLPMAIFVSILALHRESHAQAQIFGLNAVVLKQIVAETMAPVSRKFCQTI